ncbi:MAG: NAD(P)H-quinone oxidoreductase [Pseudomonadota bacterium]
MQNLPKTMRAVHIDNPGPESRLVLKDTPIPKPQPGEALIKIHAAGINRPDLFQRLGNYPPPAGVTEIPGLEIAGEIIRDASGRYNQGDKVIALLAGGGYAEYAAAPLEQILPLPAPDMPMTVAAGIPETFFTVWTNLFDSGQLKSGETVLIHGGSSGIGTTAIQIARLFDCTVIITAGSDEKCSACRKLGADHAINYKTQDFVSEIKTLTDNRGVDLVLDMVGGDYLRRNVQSLAPFGRHVSIASLNGKIGEVEIFRVMKNRLTLTGSTLRARSPAEKGRIAAALQENIWPALAEGRIRPVIDSVYDFDDVARAHSRMQDGGHIGKIILSVQ